MSVNVTPKSQIFMNRRVISILLKWYGKLLKGDIYRQAQRSQSIDTFNRNDTNDLRVCIRVIRARTHARTYIHVYITEAEINISAEQFERNDKSAVSRKFP